MAFGNISTLYIPATAAGGSSLWGTNVRQLLDVADPLGQESAAVHGTGGAVTRTYEPYATSTADSDQSLFGWAVTPTDMNSVSGARRFFPAGSHTTSTRMRHSASLAQTGTLSMYVYRVGPAPGRTRTLLGSNTASVSLPVLAGTVTATVTVTLGEIIFEPDETIQYSYEFNVSGVAITGENTWFNGGTAGGVVATISTPKLGVLADTTGSSSGSSTGSAVGGKVLGTQGTSTGTGTAAASMGSTAAATGSAAGSATVDGQGSSVAGTVGTASGLATVTGLASIVLGTVGTVEPAAGGGTTVIGKPTTLRRLGGSVSLNPGQIVPIEPAWYDNNGNPVSPVGAVVSFRDFSTGLARYWDGTGWTATPTTLPTTAGRYVLTVPSAWLGLAVAVTASLSGQQDLTDTYTVDDTTTSRATAASVAAVQADTDAMQTDLVAIEAGIDALGTPAQAAALATVQADTDDIQTTLAAKLDVTVSSRASQASVTALGSPAQAADYTAARAALLDRLDATVSSRASAAALATVQADTDDLQASATALAAAITALGSPAQASALAALVTTVGTPAQAAALTTADLDLLANILTRATPDDVQVTLPTTFGAHMEVG